MAKGDRLEICCKLLRWFESTSAHKPDAGWSSLEARRAHNPKVIGSNPIPATSKSAKSPSSKPSVRPMAVCRQGSKRQSKHLAAYDRKRSTQQSTYPDFCFGSLFAQIAQLVEQRTENPRVTGSIPVLGTIRGTKAFHLKR